MNGTATARPERTAALPQLGRHTLIYLIASLASRFAAFLVLPIFTRFLDKAEYGILEMTDATLAFLLQLCGFQLDAALTRFYTAAGTDRERAAVVATALFGTGVLSVGVALLLAVPAPLVAGWLFDDPGLALLVRLSAVILCAMTLGELALSVLKAERRSVAASSASLVRLALELSAKITLVVALGLGVTGVLLGQASAAAIFLVAALIWLVSRFGTHVDRKLLARMALYAAPMVLSGFCQFALHQADRFLLKAMCGLDATGVYGIGYKFGYAVNGVVLGAFLLIWYPVVFTVKDEGPRRDLLSSALLHVPVLIAMLSLPLALLAPEVIALFTESRYHGAWIYVPVVLLAYVMWSAFQVAQTPFYVHARTGAVFRLVALAAAVNIAANVVLLPHVGPMGAAYATLIALTFLAVITYRSARKLDAMAFDARRALLPAALWTAALTAVYAVPLTSAWSFPLRAALILLAAGAYLGVFLRPEERAHARAMIPRRGVRS